MAQIGVDVDELFTIQLRRPTSANDDSCRHGVQFGNVIAQVETCICSIGLSYYELADANVRKADVYIVQRPFKVLSMGSTTAGAPPPRTSVAFVGVRATTAHELYVALLELTRNKLTVEQYNEIVKNHITLERSWQEQRVAAAQNVKTSGDDDSKE